MKRRGKRPSFMNSCTFQKVSLEGFVLTKATSTMESWKTYTEHLRNKGYPENKPLTSVEKSPNRNVSGNV
jgi:hypothetical protein